MVPLVKAPLQVHNSRTLQLEQRKRGSSQSRAVFELRITRRAGPFGTDSTSSHSFLWGFSLVLIGRMGPVGVCQKRPGVFSVRRQRLHTHTSEHASDVLQEAHIVMVTQHPNTAVSASPKENQKHKMNTKP